MGRCLFLFCGAWRNERGEDSPSLPVTPSGPSASIRSTCYLQIGSTFLRARVNRKIFISTSPGLSWVLPLYEMLLVWLPLFTLLPWQSIHASVLSLLLWRMLGSPWCGCFTRICLVTTLLFLLLRTWWTHVMQCTSFHSWLMPLISQKLTLWIHYLGLFPFSLLYHEASSLLTGFLWSDRFLTLLPFFPLKFCYNGTFVFHHDSPGSHLRHQVSTILLWSDHGWLVGLGYIGGGWTSRSQERILGTLVSLKRAGFSPGMQLWFSHLCALIFPGCGLTPVSNSLKNTFSSQAWKHFQPQMPMKCKFFLRVYSFLPGLSISESCISFPVINSTAYLE